MTPCINVHHLRVIIDGKLQLFLMTIYQIYAAFIINVTVKDEMNAFVNLLQTLFV